MKTISIIIINHNGEKFLERLFKTIQVQTFQDFEVIFVDNDSEDESVAFVEEKYSNTKIILNENLGYGSGCNVGARYANGKYLIFLNEDMYLPKDFLEKLITFRNELPHQEKIGAISCKMVDFDAEPDDFRPTYGAKIDIFGFPVKARNSEETFIVSGSPMFIRRDLFLKIRGFNEAIFIYGEDVDLSWRLNILGYHNFTINSTCLYHFGGGATGAFGPKKIADIMYGTFVPVFTNYNLTTLLFILPVFFVFIVCFYLILSIAKFNIDYIREAINKINFFRSNIKKAMSMRHFVQANRKRSDIFFKKYISLVPALIANKSLEKLHEGYAITNY